MCIRDRDITVQKTVGGRAAQVTKFNQPLTVTISLPEEIQGHILYSLICRNGDTSGRNEDQDAAAETATFPVSGSGLFGLVYADTEEIHLPQTGDAGYPAAAWAFLLLAGFGMVAVSGRKKNRDV